MSDEHIDIKFMRVLRFTSRTAIDGCKKMKKKERKNCRSIKADAATDINHNSVSKHMHILSFEASAWPSG